MTIESAGIPNSEQDEAMMWVLVKKIKSGDIAGAKEMIASGVILNDEAKETVGWLKVKAVKDGNSELAQFIDSILN